MSPSMAHPASRHRVGVERIASSQRAWQGQSTSRHLQLEQHGVVRIAGACGAAPDANQARCAALVAAHAQARQILFRAHILGRRERQSSTSVT